MIRKSQQKHMWEDKGAYLKQRPGSWVLASPKNPRKSGGHIERLRASGAKGDNERGAPSAPQPSEQLNISLYAYSATKLPPIPGEACH